MDKPAFPYTDWGANSDSGLWPVSQAGGLTRRELIAAMAMQGIYANADCTDADFNQCAGMAVNAADALIAVLDAEPQS